MTAEQILALVRTWPEFEYKPLDWLEELPPDTPFVSALSQAPKDCQWVQYFEYYAVSRLSSAQRGRYQQRVKAAERARNAAYEQAHKAWDEAVKRAHQERDLSSHQIWLEFVGASRGALETALSSLYAELEDTVESENSR